MDTETFWNLIETARKNSGGDIEKQTKLLIETLAELPEEDIVEFHRISSDTMRRAFRGDLWDAASLILCMCTEDDFSDFRTWLIAQGKSVFEKALKDPDSLAEVVSKEHRNNGQLQSGDFGSAASEAYERRTNQEMPIIRQNYVAMIGKTHPPDELPSLFPHITAKLGNCNEWWEKLTEQAITF